MSIYVLVHGAWHTGKELEPVAASIKTPGNGTFTPTIKGNRPGDPKTIGLAQAIESIVDYLVENDLKDIVLVGHSYGGMIITGVADSVPGRIRRLVYWNAFVPNHGESVLDMVPPQYVALFDAIAAERGDGSIVLPFPIWREAFINDADLDTAQKAYGLLNPHPYKTLSDKISLKVNPAELTVAKSYINCTEDTSLPQHYPWHPRLSQKLGLFRLVQVPGSHELCFSNPARLAQAILDAGRDWANVTPGLLTLEEIMDELTVNHFDGAAYNMAAVTATIALYRALVKKGVLPREEAMQILLDEAIAHAMETEALMQEPGVSETTIEINRQCEEILKFIAEHLWISNDGRDLTHAYTELTSARYFRW